VLVQCKHYSRRQVGVRTIRELYGVMAAERVADGVVITTGSFTRGAREFATGKRLQLLDGPGVIALLDRDSTSSAASDESGDTKASSAIAPRLSVRPGARVVCPSCSERSPLDGVRPSAWRCPSCGWARPGTSLEANPVRAASAQDPPAQGRDGDVRRDLAQIDALLNAIEERRAGRPIPDALSDAGARLAAARSAIARGDWVTQQAVNAATDRLATLRARLLPHAGARSDRQGFGIPGSVWAAPADGELHRRIGSVQRYADDAPGV
jgi:restriction endonuclease